MPLALISFSHVCSSVQPVGIWHVTFDRSRIPFCESTSVRNKELPTACKQPALNCPFRRELKQMSLLWCRLLEPRQRASLWSEDAAGIMPEGGVGSARVPLGTHGLGLQLVLMLLKPWERMGLRGVGKGGWARCLVCFVWAVRDLASVFCSATISL